ncbi:MAG TPA: phosphatidate cytidylyltransferase [Candidatus Limnocylindria bacterium]|nr:phosphatidate cytidylyltransferase [Candidatus Limnocylindria bacterium]
MLRTRLVSAVVLAPLVLAVVFLGEPWLSLLVGVIAFLALVEVIALLDAAGFEPPQVLALALGTVLAATVLVAANRALVGGLLAELLRVTTVPGLPIVAFVAAVLLLAVASFARAEPRAGFLTWATTSFGVAYAGLLAPFIVLVAHLGPVGGSAETQVGALSLRAGSAWALLLILTVWGYDTGAYLTGRWIGRRRLIDHISPSKTVEGLAGGLLAATLAAGLGAWLVGLPAWQPLVIGPLLGLAAQAGDLAESLLKRAAGRKESGFLIPGHGGMLDRIDSFLFAAPTLAGFALLAGGAAL